MAKKHELREFVIIPLMIIVLMIGAFFLSDNVNGIIGDMFLPRNKSIIEQIKLVFTPFTIVIIIEYLLLYEMPNNYLFSRIISFITTSLLIICFNLIYLFFTKEIIVMIYFPFFVIFIYFSQSISYLIQKAIPIKMSFMFSFFIYLIICLCIFLISAFPTAIF